VSVVAPPQRQRPDTLEALIREARERQRHRQLRTAGFAVLVVAVGLASFAVASAVRQTKPRQGGAPAVPLQSCEPNQLRLTAAVTWNVAAGSLLEPFRLTNVSDTACSLAGWPEVRLVDAGGRVIPTRSFRYTYSDRIKVPFRVVTVRPGRAASFNYFAPDWSSESNSACPNARRVQIRLPAAHKWSSVARTIPACGTLFVDPFVPGRTDARWGAVRAQHLQRP
jgi:Protein of unknown function (DUF4232)